MIWLYSGTPGSGKSLHVAKDIYTKVGFRKQNVIANFEVDTALLYKGKKHGTFVFCDNRNLTVKWLTAYAMQNHVRGREGQTLLIIDECQVHFNPREFGRKDRLDWISFFCEHRKLGFNVILVTQFDRLLDRQIRSLVEYEYKHRKVNNFKIGMLLPFPMFCAVEYWYGVREKLSTSFFPYRRKYGALYDTFKTFHGDGGLQAEAPQTEGGEGPARSAGGALPEVCGAEAKNVQQLEVMEAQAPKSGEGTPQ